MNTKIHVRYGLIFAAIDILLFVVFYNVNHQLPSFFFLMAVALLLIAAVVVSGPGLSIHLNLDPTRIKDVAEKYPAFKALEQLPLFDQSSLINGFPYKIDEVRRETLNRIISCKYVHQQAKYFFRRNFLDMYLQFLTQLKNEKQPKLELDQRTIDRLSLLKMYLSSHLDFDITLPAMAVKSQLTEDVITRGFEQLFNISFDDYLLQVRMYRAYDLLMQTPSGKTAVAHKTGYYSYMAFVRAFIKFFGCDPVTLRREQ